MPRRSDRSRFTVNVLPRETPANAASFASEWHLRCVTLYDELIPYIVELLRIFEYTGRWTGDATTRQLMSSLWTDCIHRLSLAEDCAMSLQLRQNPLNACQLQQSLNGGLTWTLAFDYSLCRAPGSEFVIWTEINNLFQQWSTTTTNTEINNFAPTVTFTSSTGETTERINARRLALCAATRLYVYAYCEAIREINHNAAAANNLVALGLGIATAVAALATFATEGATLPLYLALSAALAAAGGAAYSALTDAVLDDTAAKDELACCMFNTLADVAPTAENFAAAADDCAGLSANAEIIRSTLANDISNPAGLENQFNAFVNLLGENLRPAELGLLDDCPCVTMVRLYSDYARTILVSTVAYTLGVPFSVEIDSSTWASQEVYIMWNRCLAYHYEITGTITATIGEKPFERYLCDNSLMTGTPGDIATNLPNDTTGKGIFVNNREDDPIVYTIEVTLTDD